MIGTRPFRSHSEFPSVLPVQSTESRPCRLWKARTRPGGRGVRTGKVRDPPRAHRQSGDAAIYYRYVPRIAAKGHPRIPAKEDLLTASRTDVLAGGLTSQAELAEQCCCLCEGENTTAGRSILTPHSCDALCLLVFFQKRCRRCRATSPRRSSQPGTVSLSVPSSSPLYTYTCKADVSVT